MTRTLRALVLVILLFGAAAGAPQKERALTDKEKAELDRAVDDILRFVSEGTGLEVKQPVKREFTDRAGLRAHFEKNAGEENRDRMRRAELVLKKIGLLPRDFDLQKFSLELTVDRVAGYYDTKRKTIVLLDFIPPVRQKPILAHELMHALQDQHYGITDWAKAIAEVTPELADDELDGVIEAEEAAFARRAVVEGQANVALVQYAVKAADEWAGPGAIRSRSARQAPVMMALLEPGRDSEVYKNAPVVLKESMSFPYSFGYLFVRALQEKDGAKLAFAEVMRRPPSSSRHIMQPRTYLKDEKLERMRVPRLKAALGERYRRLSAGVMSQFDVYVLGKHFENEGTAERLAKRWRGGVHYAAVPANVNDSELRPAQVAWLYLSRWESGKAARDFAKRYAKWLGEKYARVTPAGEMAWNTSEGPVWIEVRGDAVLVLEGFAGDLSERVRAAAWESVTP